MQPHRQLRKAWKDSGLTLADLKKSAKFKASVVSLSRKLSGQQPLSHDEIAAIASVLGVEVTLREVTVTVGRTAAA